MENLFKSYFFTYICDMQLLNIVVRTHFAVTYPHNNVPKRGCLLLHGRPVFGTFDL